MRLLQLVALLFFAFISHAQHHHDDDDHGHGDHDDMDMDMTNQFKLEVSTHKLPEAGSSIQLDISVLDWNTGKSLSASNFEDTHLRKMHLVLLSTNGEYFSHLHPEDFELTHSDDSFSFLANFPVGGDYLVATDFAAHLPEQEHAMDFSLYHRIHVRGPVEDAIVRKPALTAAAVLAELEGEDSYRDFVKRPESATGELTFRMEIQNEKKAIEPNKCTPLLFHVNSSQPLLPLLGAASHLLAINMNTLSEPVPQTMHLHGIPEKMLPPIYNQVDPEKRCSHELMHEVGLMNKTDRFELPILTFANFPGEGHWLLILQVKVNETHGASGFFDVIV